jgi:DNA primase
MARGASSGRITQRSIERVLERADLVELASGYTEMHKRGAEHSGRCPFHDERTPSFWVNGTKGVYHCFGCGASGDVISFVQSKQGLDFVEAVEALADRFRVDLEYEDGGAGKTKRLSKRRLYELTDATTSFYEGMLLQSAEAEPVREYLRERGVGMDAVRAFRMGYSPDGGNVLAAKAIAKGFTKDELLEARLIGAKGHDFFRGRWMIPIIDRAGRVQGFGARKLREEQFGGKYVNSSDGPLFHKKLTIFQAPGIATAARESGSVVVVEGYMDVIAMWQAGFRNVCAVMGTALTEEQVVELKRLAPRALFAFDPDAAGQVATMRALEQARSHELDVRVVLLPEGEDPADVLHGGGEGRERMRELLDGGVSFLHYRTNALLGSGDLRDATERDRIYQEAVTLFQSVPDGPARREQIMRLANALQLDGDSQQALFAATGAETPMRLTRPDSWEPKSHEQRAVRQRVASTGGRSTAVVREKRLLATAMRYAENTSAAAVAALLPPVECLALDVHARAYEALASGGAPALAPAQIREDAELLSLVAELSAIVEKDMLATTDDEVLVATVRELARAVELQHVERLAGQLRSQMAGDDVSAEILAQYKANEARRRELQPDRSASAPL